MKNVSEYVNEAIVKGKLKQYNTSLKVYKSTLNYNKNKHRYYVYVDNEELLNKLSNILEFNNTEQFDFILDRFINKGKPVMIRPNIRGAEEKVIFNSYTSKLVTYEYYKSISTNDFTPEYWEKNGWFE